MVCSGRFELKVGFLLPPHLIEFSWLRLKPFKNYFLGSMSKNFLKIKLLLKYLQDLCYFQKFLYYVLKSSDVLEVLVPILYHLNDSRADQCKLLSRYSYMQSRKVCHSVCGISVMATQNCIYCVYRLVQNDKRRDLLSSFSNTIPAMYTNYTHNEMVSIYLSLN